LDKPLGFFFDNLEKSHAVKFDARGVFPGPGNFTRGVFSGPGNFTQEEQKMKGKVFVE
jgi:hypothetical protein